jgi:hypothetical protein
MKIYNRLGSFKVLALISLILSITLSCKKLPEPSFSYSPMDNPEAGELIRFNNESVNANSFNWDFGDGGNSSAEHPEYTFLNPGSYEVKLTARNEDGEDSYAQTVTINHPTILGFQVFDSTGANLLASADVWIYDNEEDLVNLRDPLYSGVTDQNGEIRFYNLEPIVYYFLAVKYAPGGAWLFALNTPALEQNEENYFYFNCLWFPDETQSIPNKENKLGYHEFKLRKGQLNRK